MHNTINSLVESALIRCNYMIGDIHLDIRMVEELLGSINALNDNLSKLRLFSNFTESELNGFQVSNYVKVFISGYIEYIYRLNKVKVPGWVMNKKYRLIDLSENPDYWILKPSVNNRTAQAGFERVLKHQLDNSIPEFKWRRLIMESV